MKRKFLYRSIVLAIMLSLLLSGCGMRKSSSVVGDNGNNPHTDALSDKASEEETKELEKYSSLIQKYVGKAGSRYKAYDEILKWDDYYDTVACMIPSEKWLDSDGKLRVPFDIDTVMSDGQTAYAYFYVPDELAVKASTGELVDICLLYAPVCHMNTPTLDIEYTFDYFLNKSNALEEALRRDDFAEEFFKRYMAESENIPVYREKMDENEYSEGSGKIMTLNAMELILSQPEAYEQLTEEQRVTLVKRIIEREKNGNQGAFFFTNASDNYKSFFLSCITGDEYISGNTGECIWEVNPWIDAIRNMNLSDEERNVTECYI